MLILENVCKTYSTGFPALNNISLRVEKGEFVFIVGQSGAGKSTLIKLLLKELEPTSGHIFINGKNLGRAKRRELPMIRRDMGVVFQDFRLLEDRNIYDNIAFAQKVVEAPNRRTAVEIVCDVVFCIVPLSRKKHGAIRAVQSDELSRAFSGAYAGCTF